MQLVGLFVFLIYEKFSLFWDQTQIEGSLHKLKSFTEKSNKTPNNKNSQKKIQQKSNKAK